MNVLLINPLCRLPYMLPLGLGYIASVLRQEGYNNVKILDINGFGYSDQKVEEMIRTLEFDVVGIGGLTSTYRYVKWLASIIKKYKPRVPIVAGNMVSTAHPELLLRNSKVDIAVIDEGEITFKELLSTIHKGRGLKEIKGIFYKNNTDVLGTPPRERITNLDFLPFPAWDLFPMETYLNNSTQSPVRFGLRSINISTVRGCPYDCTFCSRPFGRKVYARSAESIVGEMKELRKRYKVEFISFSDDLFLFNEQHILELCERMLSENLGIKWAGAARVNLVNDNLLSRMHQAGCAELGFGFESGNQRILDRMQKRVTVKQAEEAIKMTRRAKIRIAASFIFGMPGETTDSIKDTLAFIKRMRLPAYRFFYATPYPNTELYQLAKKMGRLPADEDKYMESLGEMRTTFLVNLTEFSDAELVKYKKLAETTARKNLSFKLRLEEFAENWQRRFYVVRQCFRNSGFISAVKMVWLRVVHKLKRG